MPYLFVFLLKVNAALILFWAGYYFVLRHLTFYNLNRIYLVAAILFASLYPQINLNNFALQHQQIARPVEVVLNWQAPAAGFIKPLTQPTYWHLVELVFWIVAFLLAVRLLLQLFSLFKLYRASNPARIFDHNVRVISSDAGPFSFWKSIYVNPANHTLNDLKAILLHEQVHVNEWHTVDILLAEISTIFYWFNPGVWLMKKAVRENIEFITDRKILNAGMDSKQYQYSLVNVSFAAASNSIVNNFNISTIKKRIIMMNAKRSSKFKLTRYLVLLPVVIVLLLVFSFSKAAFVKKGNKAYKAFAKTVSGIGNQIKAQAADEPATEEARNISLPATGVNTASLPLTTTGDTIKKGNIFISTPHSADSLNYVIDGVKGTRANFNAVNSDKIYSVDLVSPEVANKIIAGLDNKQQTIFITTDGSDKGRKIKEKLNKLNANSAVTIARGASGSYGSGVSVGVGVASSPEAKSAGLARGKYTYIKRTASSNAVGTTVSTGTSLDPVIVVDPAVQVYTSNDSIYVAPVTTNVVAYKVASDKSANKANTTYTLNSARPVKGVYTLKKASGNTNIVHLSAKLIFINDKEATAADLKKLSAADIESMSTKNDDYTRYQYGEKAKNGVVYIYTKKKK
jgi:bla regulator protein BlaR1